MRLRLLVLCGVLCCASLANAKPVGYEPEQTSIFCESNPTCPSGYWYEIEGTNGVRGRLGTIAFEPDSGVFDLEKNWDLSLLAEYRSPQFLVADPYTCTCFHLSLEWKAENVSFSNFLTGYSLDYYNFGVDTGPDTILSLVSLPNPNSPRGMDFWLDIWETSPLHRGTVTSGDSVSRIKSITYVPEPATWTMTLLGASIVAFRRKRLTRRHR
jgi:hypothetical protein